MAAFSKNLSRRTFLKCLSLAGISATATGAYGKVIGAEWLEVGRHEIPLGKGLGYEPLKILHLSDLHASEMVSLDFIERAVNLGVGLKPDLICLTGDYITRKYDQWDEYAKVLSGLSKAAPTFATLGNHDGGHWCVKYEGYHDSQEVRDLLANANIELLDNHSRQLRLRGRKVNVVGLGDVWCKEFVPGKAFENVCADEDCITTVLSHNPDTKDDLKSYGWDLLLSGHTHGGQVSLPFIGTPIGPIKDKRFMKGLHRWDGRWINVTKGVGNLYGIRVNCRPEVSLLTLV